nr:PAS domain S-box protein [Burkholderiales bacterium]
PPSAYKSGRAAPAWFTHLVQPELATINLPVQGGNLRVRVDASRSVVDAWDDTRSLIALLAGFLLAVNVAVFFYIGGALRPLRRLVRGLERMQQRELHTRLPLTGAREFVEIGRRFNEMADSLERSDADNRRLALVAEQSSDAIVIHDLDGRIAFWNPAAERLFGLKAAQALGMEARRFVPDPLRDEADAISDAVRARRGIDHVETRRRAADGTERDVALSVAPLVDPGTDTVIGEIHALRDIGEAQRARAAEFELQQNRRLTQAMQTRLEEERRAIARELHDELGQCLTAIRTFGTVIATRTVDGDADVHRSALTIVDVAGTIYDAVHGIIRQLRPVALDHLGLRETLAEVIANWRRLQPGIDCETRLDADIEGLGEAVNIAAYRVVQECLTNVVKHAAATRVEVEVARLRGDGTDRLLIAVRDNGRGLAERSSVEAARFGLLGMRERVEALGGDFSVAPNPGAGLAVTASIPLNARPVSPTEEVPA